MTQFDYKKSEIFSMDVFPDYIYGYPSKRKYKPIDYSIESLWKNSKFDKINIYIHIPFCLKKCKFCNLYSTDKVNINVVDLYVKSIVKQIAAYGLVLKGCIVDSVYIGGGTPTILSEKNFDEIFNTLNRHFTIDSNRAEVAIEGCPVTLGSSREKLSLVKKLGVNRISVGVQSFNNDELRYFGRTYDEQEAHKAINTIREVGFRALNLDMIYGIPNQSLEGWIQNAEKLLSYSPESATLYPLNIREDTMLHVESEQRTKSSIAILN